MDVFTSDIGFSRNPKFGCQGSCTPFLGMGPGGHGNAKISGVLTKIGKFDIVLMYDISIARLIPIIKLTLVYYAKRERKMQVYYIIVFCKIVNMYCKNMFCIYRIPY